jgi:isoleucyl-tRNA synthetase
MRIRAMKFPNYPSQIDFPKVEVEVLERWRARDVFRRSVDGRPLTKRFSFYDGPPFATGLPHYGHLLAGTIKDVVPRYWTMRGYRVERRFGWDCHGLPVEFEVEKALDLKGRGDIETYGVEAFNGVCRSIVLRYTNEWRTIVERMGRWVDFDDEYKTMDVSFMESVWNVFKRLWDEGLVYEGYRVVPYSWRIGAPLSNFEANLDYRDVQDPSLTLRFELEPGLYALVWTTTPWTLPANLALAVDAERDYAVVQVDGEADRLVILPERIDAYWKGGEGVTQVGTVRGADLVGRRYVPLLPFFADRAGSGAFRVIAGDFITTDTGTGIVHIAPAFGEDDFQACREAGIELVDPTDDDGRFTAAVPPYQGQQVKDADRAIIADLKASGKVFRHETYVHSYPFCYRSETPLIYKAISAWYVRVEALKDRLVANNQKVRWVPGHLKDGRFGNWLDNARDWNISRNRFWGNPIPVWRNAETGETVCIGSKAELEALSGVSLDDLHKHVVDEVEIPSPTGRGVLRRVPEVLDCWFESGSMPYAQSHYPFENKEAFEEGFPADFIAEGLDQTRGWFYTLMVLSTALFDQPAFKNVIVNGLVLAEDGRKMSKRLKNYPDPEDLIRAQGADAIRMFLLQSGAVRGEELRFSEHGVRDMVRRVLLPWWNAFTFLSTYAHVDGWDPQTDAHEGPPTHELDVWVGAKLEDLKERVEREMEQFELSRVVPALLQFIDDLTNWYIRRSRRRFWKAADDADKRSAYTTLYRVLLDLTELMAPFVPFLSDHMYEMLRLTDSTKATDSVHLRDFPRARSLTPLEREVEGRQDLARIVSELGRELRANSKIRTRQPLRSVSVGTPNPVERRWLEAVRDVIAEELNVKVVTVVDDPAVLARVTIKPNFPRLGPRCGKDMKDVGQALRALDAAGVARFVSGEGAVVAGYELGPDDVLVHMDAAEAGHLVTARGSLVVSLETDIDEDLRLEGLAREVVSRIQKMRKELDLRVDARIALGLVTEGDLARALAAHVAYVAAETLATVELGTALDAPTATDAPDIDGHPLTITLRA